MPMIQPTPNCPASACAMIGGLLASYLTAALVGMLI